MWNERYAGDAFAYGTEPNDFLREQVTGIQAGRTLCIGEGEGRNAVHLATLGHKVTALDAAEAGLEKTKLLASRKGAKVETLHADLADYAFETSAWDLIVSIFCHLPPNIRRKVHGQIATALRPGGHFILEAYTPDQLQYGTGGPGRAEMMMDADTLREELKGLDFELVQEVTREIQEGAFHNGLGATVQVVARKPVG